MSRPRSWPAMAFAFVGACALCSAPCLRPALAQQPSAASDELLQAILRYAFRFDGGNVRLLEGRIPDDLGPNFYAPSGTRVLGSVVMGSGVLVLAKSTAAAESLRAAYVHALAPHGWRPIEMMRRGGFVEGPTALPLTLCRGDAQLQVARPSSAAGASDLHLFYHDAAGGCDDGARSATFRRVPEPSSFPTLYPPSGTDRDATMRCLRSPARVGSARASSTMGAVATDMSASELLRHYGTQLEAQGWRPIDARSRSVATGTWSRADTTGAADLRLQVREMGPPARGCYGLEMTLSDTPR
jgi:hypothetical protein